MGCSVLCRELGLVPREKKERLPAVFGDHALRAMGIDSRNTLGCLFFFSSGIPWIFFFWNGTPTGKPENRESKAPKAEKRRRQGFSPRKNKKKKKNKKTSQPARPPGAFSGALRFAPGAGAGAVRPGTGGFAEGRRSRGAKPRGPKPKLQKQAANVRGWGWKHRSQGLRALEPRATLRGIFCHCHDCGWGTGVFTCWLSVVAWLKSSH